MKIIALLVIATIPFFASLASEAVDCIKYVQPNVDELYVVHT
jgi:hypothetical protein